MHVPNKYRVRTGRMGTDDDAGNNGAFFLPVEPGKPPLAIIASDGGESFGEVPWEHVSVSLPTRCPTWSEMDKVKRTFWDDEDAVMQLHPPRSDWVNNHSFCLHLWRPTTVAIPLPPSWTVGDATLGTLV